MYIEQNVLPDTEGKFVFMRPDRQGLTPVEVQTEFTSLELQGIFAVCRQDGYWQRFTKILSTENANGSGTARDMLSDRYAKMPVGFGLKTKTEAILNLNVILTAASLIPDNPDESAQAAGFLRHVFFTQNPQTVAEVVNGLKMELGALLTQHGWLVDIEEQLEQLGDPEMQIGAMRIINLLKQQRADFQVE